MRRNPVDAAPLLAYCESRRASMVETIEALVRAESPTGDKAAVDRCGHVAARYLTELGARVERVSPTAASRST